MTQPSGSRHPTIYDVAKAAGVSKSLVSLVLQGSPRVSAARRAAVEDAIQRLHYRPSRAAATLAGRRTRTVGVLLDDYRNLWFVELLAGIQDELAPLGFRVAVENSAYGAGVDSMPLDGFLSLRVDGIVVAMEPSEAMAVTAGIPVVIAGSRELRLPGADVAANDDQLGGGLATNHLLELGHHRIGHLSGLGGAGRLRAQGYHKAIRTAGLTPRTACGAAGGTTEVDGYQAASRLLDEQPDTTALFASNDTMALGAMAAARERGRRIPEDVSLIGYDNSPLAATHLLQLTTIDGMNAQVGVAAATSLLSRIDNAQLPVRTSLVTPELVLRSTTSAPGDP